MIPVFLRFDLQSWFPRRQTLLTLLLVVAVGIILPLPGMAIIAAALVTSLMVSTPFLGDERGHLDTLYGVLPVSRGSVVAGRAMSLVVYYLVATTLAIGATVAVVAVRGSSISPSILLIALAAGAGFVGISLALQLPVFFRIGYSRGRLMAYAPTIVIAGGAWILQATGLHTPLLDILAPAPTAALVAVGAGIGALGLLIALGASTASYRTREL